MKDRTTHTVAKSNQNCFLIPWHSPRDNCPFAYGYEQVAIPRKDGLGVDIQIVKLSNLRKRINNMALPKGTWVHLN